MEIRLAKNSRLFKYNYNYAKGNIFFHLDLFLDTLIFEYFKDNFEICKIIEMDKKDLLEIEKSVIKHIKKVTDGNWNIENIIFINNIIDKEITLNEYIFRFYNRYLFKFRDKAKRHKYLIEYIRKNNNETVSDDYSI